MAIRKTKVSMVDDAGDAAAKNTGTGSGDVAAGDHNHSGVYQPADAALDTLAGAGNSAVLAATTASFLTADETKLDGIESGATADQSAAEILTAVKTVDGAASGLDADLLDGNEASAFALAGAPLIIPASDHTAEGPNTAAINAGATVAAFELVYLASTGKWVLTDADAAATAIGMLALALEAGTDTNPMSVALAGSLVRDDTWVWTVGAVLYVSTTPGAMTETAPSATGDIVRVVGYAVSADVVYFLPSGGWVEIA
jgi:hypothetical protein